MNYMTTIDRAPHTRTVTKRELNQQTARVLDAIDEGESVVVTERGVPTWRIVRMTFDDDLLERLRQAGLIAREASKNPRPLTMHAEPPRYTPEEIDAILDEVRADKI